MLVPTRMVVAITVVVITVEVITVVASMKGVRTAAVIKDLQDLQAPLDLQAPQVAMVTRPVAVVEVQSTMARALPVG
jgi:hypothetical protein